MTRAVPIVVSPESGHKQLTAPPILKRPDRLPSYAVFAGVLSAAGLPIYVHAPKFYVDNYDVGLASLGGVLFVLRLIDVLQDPALGWLSGRLGRYRGMGVGVAALIMSVAMLGIFALPPAISPVFWFALMLALLFSGYSFLNISFYALGVEKVTGSARLSHVRLASWRETGALTGVCVAAVIPTLFAIYTPSQYTAFAVLFIAGTLVAVVLMRREWSTRNQQVKFGFLSILTDPIARRLLLIALVNASPVAVTSTIFLFFVETRIEAPGSEGLLLFLFFLSAAVSAPLWGRAAARFSAKTALLGGMVLSIFIFGYAAFLGEGDVLKFAFVCAVSGAALGADMTLLPAIFAKRIAALSHNAGQSFGLWSFVSKLSLAMAAVILLPVLDAVGLNANQPSTEPILITLTLLYAILPCGLKLVAVILLVSSSRLEN